MSGEEKQFNRNILIAVDESENAGRAVSYVAQLLGDLGDFQVALLHVVSEPEEDYFRTDQEREEWMEQRQRKVEVMLKAYKAKLIAAGFPSDKVSIRSPVRYCPSMAQCILAERDETEYSTIVVGRQGLSRSEEFLFGSVSSKIVNHARNCTVWVVE